MTKTLRVVRAVAVGLLNAAGFMLGSSVSAVLLGVEEAQRHYKASGRVAVAALLACGLFAETAHAAGVSDRLVVFGSTFGGPKSLMVTSTGDFTVSLAPGLATDGRPNAWHPGLTITPVTGTGPRTLSVAVDKCRARPNEVDHTTVRIADAKGFVDVDIRVSCSGQSRCGPDCGAPTARPTTQPTAIATVRPTATLVSNGTARPTGQPTVPTARPTSVPSTLPTVGPPASRPLAQPGPKLPQVRPIPYILVSLQRDFQEPRQFTYLPSGDGYVVVTSDNAALDAQEHTRLSAVQELTSLLDDWRFVDCFDDVQEAINVSSGLSHPYRDLMGPYVVAGKLNDGVSGTWADRNAYYNIAGFILRKYQKCLLTKAMVVACAALPSEYLDLLALSVEGGRCIDRPRLVLPPEPDKVDKAFLRLGPITTDHLMPGVSAKGLGFLNAATSAHACASLAVFDGRACPGGTQEHLRRYQDDGANSEDVHARQLIPFPKGDKRWNAYPKEHAAIAMGELLTWGDGSGSMPLSWDGQQRGAGNWGLSRAAEYAHFLYHAIAAHMWVREFQGTWVDRSPPYLYRFPCRLGDAFSYDDKCPEESQATVLNRILRGDYGVYGRR